ncbi:MAG: hypothetical protein EBY09_20790, partial [Verrucomicrobia bacterium]|nr:hypothetical protein [Verrucomicrobiota bacterium]NDF01223.1 hypothetical protein [Verrucomicrobiota bacterium]
TALIEVLFSTGMRVSEVVAVNVGHIDMDRLTIQVHGKGNRERQSPIVCDALREALDYIPVPIFELSRGRLLRECMTNTISQHWQTKNARKKANPAGVPQGGSVPLEEAA